MTRWQSVPVATFATLLFIHGANIIVGFDASVIERAISRKSFVKRGRSPHDAMHEVVIAIKQLNLDVVESELLQRSTPNDPKYQQWLSYEDIGRLVANLNSAELVAQWLADNEVVATWKSQHLEYIKAQAPIEKWEILLQTKFYSWEDLTVPEGERRRTMHRALEYALPEHVASHISAVFNTVQTPPAWKPHYHTRHHSDATVTETARSLLRGEGQQSSSSPLATATATGQVTVSFLNQLYHIPSNTGSSEQQQSVFETGNEYFSSNDLRKFQQTFNLPLQGVAQDFGYDTDNCNKYDCFEGNLDVQYMMGVAQRTQMIYWYQDGTDPFIDWITAVADTSNPPLVNSISWGSTEQGNSAESMKAFNTEAMKLAVMGVTIVVSSGDDGAASEHYLCSHKSGSSEAPCWEGDSWSGKGYFPSFPATSPYVTSVGATMGPQDGSPEVACQSQLGGVITTGGGFSTYNPTPSWQQETVDAYFASLPGDQIPPSGYNRNGRAYPDISLIGVEYMTFIQGSLYPLFGTSASTPVFGAMISLINAARAAQNKTSVGFVNPSLYAYSSASLANKPSVNVSSGSSTPTYGDVTSGHNKCLAYNNQDYENAFCCASGFFAAPGWDPVTGLGSITFGNLSLILATPVAFSFHDNRPKSSNLILIISIVLIGSVLVATLIAGTVYSLCFASRAPSQYEPAARTEIALTHYPDTMLQSMHPQQPQPQPQAPQMTQEEIQMQQQQQQQQQQYECAHTAVNPLYALPQHPPRLSVSVPAPVLRAITPPPAVSTASHAVPVPTAALVIGEGSSVV